MSLTLKIALTYLKSRNKRGFISFISTISTLGLIISIMSLIVVLSVMNGFQNELKTRILGAISHAYITGNTSKMSNSAELITRLQNHKQVIGVSPYIEQYALLTSGNEAIGSIIRGIEPKLEQSTSELLAQIRYGTSTMTQKNHILIGYGLATTLGVGIGDKITVFTPDINRTIVGVLPRFKRFKLVGIFDAGVEEYNNSLSLIRLDTAQGLYKFKDNITGLRLRFDDVLQADSISLELSKELDKNHYIINWKQQKQNLLHALNLEKTMIGVILFFIIAIATFNLVSMMLMMVLDKRNDIAILRSMGMSSGAIMRIFIYQSLIISLIGIVFGVVLGILLTLNLESIILFVEQVFSFSMFPKDVFYINKLPTQLQSGDIIFTLSLAAILSILAAIYPARKASQTNISQILRRE